MFHKPALAACTASAALILGAGTALAGGAVVPVIEAAPVTVTAPTVSNWAGAYVGGSIGYTFGGDDSVGLFRYADSDSDAELARGVGLGDADLKGAAAGLHVGYRWQRGPWVFGPELGIEGGSVDASASLDPADSLGIDSVTSEVNSIVTLVLKTGYAVNPQTLVYGTFGAARGDFDYTLASGDLSDTQGYKSTGVAAGLGVERAMTERLSVFAEYQYRDFGKEALEYEELAGTVLRTNATPKHSNLKVGVNFRF
ncbi:MAG: porin family protein [Alphaproteobacteria bacterium]|nr:porin family protein [Alphaproteobacteria bacterium]